MPPRSLVLRPTLPPTAAEARIVVVNTHLYAMHVASDGHLLPQHDTVVFDEAHEVEAIFSSALGSEISAGQIPSLARATRRVLTDDALRDRIDRAATQLGEASMTASNPGDNDGSPEDLRLAHGAATDASLAAALVEIERVIAEVRSALNGIPSDDAEVRAKRERASQLASSLMRRINEARRDAPETVVWLEGGRAIKSAPLDIGRAMRSWLFAEPEGKLEGERPDVDPPSTAVFTSATLPENLVPRLSVPRARVVEVESPFDYRTNSLLYVPQIPDPKYREEWQLAAQKELVMLIKAAGGRTLALFTSTRSMRETAEALDKRISHPILLQGDMPKRVMIDRLRSDPHVVLFGTRGFFQGVDIPGQTLSVVALDRIPFPRPGEPLVEAWQDAAGGGFTGFSKVAVPLAAITLAQAVGQLIRTNTDKGVVAVLDSRLATANYRRALLRRLPPMKRTRAGDEVVQFLGRAIPARTARTRP